jgi:hypothetical protein
MWRCSKPTSTCERFHVIALLIEHALKADEHMRIISKSEKDFSKGTTLSSGLKAHIVDWYKGKGTQADHEKAVFAVHQARFRGEWLLCDCRPPEMPPPIIAPAYLGAAETFFLRRLVGPKRTTHDSNCPFFREPAPVRPRSKPDGSSPHKPVKVEFFEILRPMKMQLAQESPAAPDDRARTDSIPRLARLLWLLMHDAGLTTIRANIKHSEQLGVANAYRRLLTATLGYRIAPDRALAQNFIPGLDNPDVQLPVIYEQLGNDAKNWPDGHLPQSFAVTFATGVHAETLHLPNGQTIELASRVARPSAFKQSVPGPFLVIILIGQLAERISDPVPLRAYAQPVISETHLIAVDSDLERRTALELVDLQRALEPTARLLDIEKPLFDYDTRAGLCRPDFILEYQDRALNIGRRHIVETVAYTNDEYTAAKALTVPRMETIAPVLQLTDADLRSGHLRSMLDRTLLRT